MCFIIVQQMYYHYNVHLNPPTITKQYRTNYNSHAIHSFVPCLCVCVVDLISDKPNTHKFGLPLSIGGLHHVLCRCSDDALEWSSVVQEEDSPRIMMNPPRTYSFRRKSGGWGGGVSEINFTCMVLSMNNRTEISCFNNVAILYALTFT